MYKYSRMKILDNNHNRIENFYQDYSHIREDISQLTMILASIMHGSALGPASYSVIASHLQPVTSSNFLVMYTNDTHLIDPASNVQSCADEIAPVDSWATVSNLSLNRVESAGIVSARQGSKQAENIQMPAVPGFMWVVSINLLLACDKCCLQCRLCSLMACR
jgi:hypothetical protein